MDRLIKILKKKNVLKDRLYETTDGCGAQYRSATALWFLSSLSAKHNIVIDRSYGAPGHGKLLLFVGVFNICYCCGCCFLLLFVVVFNIGCCCGLLLLLFDFIFT
jgi:hypothetical protein